MAMYVANVISLMKPTIFGVLGGEQIPIFTGVPVDVELTPEIQSKIDSKNLELVSKSLVESLVKPVIRAPEAAKATAVKTEEKK